MGATYTRQSTYADGDTITAAHTNDEFDQLLAAFAASTGHTHDGTTGEGGPISTMAGHALTFGQGTSGSDIVLTWDGETNDGVLKWMEDEDYFEFSDDILIASTEKIQFRDTAIYINSSTDGQLDLVADTEIQIAATTIDINGAVDVSGNLSVGGNLDVTGTFDLSDSNFTNAGNIQLDSISGDSDTNTSIEFSGSDVITITTGGETQFTFNNGSILPTTNNDVDLGSDSLEFKDLYLDGSAYIDGLGRDITVATDKKIEFRDSAIYVQSSADGQLDIVADTEVQIAATTIDINGAVDVSGNLVVGGDLTITGDDLVMATNTSGALLIADGTNFNPTVIGDLSAITSVASDDVLLAVDTSGGGLKKITRSALVSGLAAGTMSNIVEDTSPQLGGDLDTNSFDIIIDDAHSINDENGNEQFIFQTTSSAVNQFDITNAATGGAPKVSATGDDSNIDFELEAKGTGHLTVRGNTNSGAIQFNCENNSHGQIVIAQPHSASVTNTLTLPAGSSSTLVSLVSTDTLTNKTLTSPVINTGTFGTSILPVSADGTTLGSATKEFSDLYLADGGQILFGNDQEITLTHVADDGLILKHVGTGDGKEPSFSFHAGDNDIAADDVLGSIFFRAPDEGAGTDAILVAAGIEAVAEGDFSASNNATKLSFKTGASEAASEKMSLSSAGLLTVSDDIVIKSAGTIGGANDTDLLTLGNGILTVAGEVSVTTLDIGGTDVTSTAAELNILDGVTATATELNIMDGVTATTTEINLIDGGTSRGTTALADGDGILINDAGTMRMTSVETVKTYMAGSAATKGFAIAMAIVFG